MKLGELISQLEAFRDTMLGVHNDTEVTIQLSGSGIEEATIDDTWVMLRAKPGRQAQGTVVIEAVEV